MNELEFFKDFLRNSNQRLTLQRQAILQVFLTMQGHFEIEELTGVVQKSNPDIGIATVYRTISLLIQCGLAAKNFTHAGKKTYEHVFRHHDHLICTRCGNTLEFENPLIEKLQTQVCQDHRFTLKSHRMILYGLCSQCQ